MLPFRMWMIGEDTQRNEMIPTREREDKELWKLEEKMIEIDQKPWRKKEYALKSAQLNGRHEGELLRIKEKVSKQKEEYLRNKAELLRRKEKSLEEALLKVGENCLTGSSLGSEIHNSQQLLPGIPDDVTLDKITTKLSWREIRNLKSVSRGWCSAIRNYLVHDARVHSHLTETFVLVHYGKGSPALRSMRDNSCFELPRIPYLNADGIGSQCVAVEGKVYIVGGLFKGPSDKVYMLDLAGQRSWTPCASMQIPREQFACGVMNGKIYVFGGTNFERSLCESEVYDPRANKWSLIAPKSSLTVGRYVATVGEDLFVGGSVYESEVGLEGKRNILQIYHPFKDEWRKVTSPFDPPEGGNIFGSEGKLYFMDVVGIWVHSFYGNSWTHVCSNSFTGLQSGNHLGHSIPHFWPYQVIAVEDKLLACGYVYNNGKKYKRPVVFGSVGYEAGKLAWREEIGWGLDERIDSMHVVHL